MNFDIAWCNQDGNCTLIAKTDYDGDPQEIKNFFLHYALGKIFELKR